MPSKRPEVRRAASLRYYHRNKKKLLAAREAERRARGVKPRNRAMTPDERREYYRLRAERKRREAGIPPRTRRTPEEARAAAAERQRRRRTGTGVGVMDDGGVDRPKKDRRGGLIAPRATMPTQPVRRVNPPTPVRVRREEPRRAPAAVREAWNRAKPNSAIKRLYPTMAALDAAADKFGDVRPGLYATGYGSAAA